MIMAMLDAGGVPPVVGSAERSYELPLGGLVDLIYDDLAGRAVKLLDSIGHYSMPKAYDWRMIWLDRDHRHQAKSFSKFVRALGLVPKGTTLDLGAIRRSYEVDREPTIAAYRVIGPVLEMSYDTTLADPTAAAYKLASFVGFPRFDIGAAAAVVHRRPPDCAPGMDFELGRVTTHIGHALTTPRPLCIEEGCTAPVLTRERCSLHYQRWRRSPEFVPAPTPPPYVPPPDPVCPWCGPYERPYGGTAACPTCGLDAAEVRYSERIIADSSAVYAEEVRAYRANRAKGGP